VADVKLGTVDLKPFELKHVATKGGYMEGRYGATNGEFLQGSTKDARYIGRHSFVNSAGIIPLLLSRFISTLLLNLHYAVMAYNKHLNLVIRPDDVWVAILTQFSAHVNAHSEKLRSLFVTFEGKKNLTV
jgi:hypothetical protein